MAKCAFLSAAMVMLSTSFEKSYAICIWVLLIDLLEEKTAGALNDSS